MSWSLRGEKDRDRYNAGTTRMEVQRCGDKEGLKYMSLAGMAMTHGQHKARERIGVLNVKHLLYGQWGVSQSCRVAE